MNILFIFDQPLNPEAGGTERVTCLLKDFFEKQGHTCYGNLEIHTDGTCSYLGENIANVYEFLFTRKISLVINQKGQDASFLKSFLSLGGQKWYNEGGKIITCLHFNPEPIPEYYYFRKKKKNSLYDYLLLLKTYVFSKRYLKKQMRTTANTFQYIIDHSDIFVVLSDTHKRYIENLLGIQQFKKIVVIPNPLTFDGVMNEEDIINKQNIALFVGRLDEYYKRISILLEAWRLIYSITKEKGWVLKIVGSGPDLERYTKYIRRHGLSNVCLEGRQNPEKYYKEAKIFCMTSVSEGLPMTILESFQNGIVPIVMGTCPVFSEIINNGVNGFVTTKDNINEYASLLCQTILLDSLDDYAKRAIVESKKYSKNKICPLWIEQIEKITNDSR